MPSVLQPPPFTPVEPVTEVLHGVEIADPYRWLEDQNAPWTRKWIEEQAVYTRTYFDGISEREQIRKRVAELLPTPRLSDPWSIANSFFFLKRTERCEQPSIVMREGLFGIDSVLINPAHRGTGDSTAVSIGAISHNARFLAYCVRHGGTDHSAIEMLDVVRNKVLPDRLPEGYCWGLAFAVDGSGFYYSHRALDDPQPNYKACFWHLFGTEPSEDKEVFFASDRSDIFLRILYSAEADLLIYPILTTGKSPHCSVYVQSAGRWSSLKRLVHDVEGCLSPFLIRGQLFAYTDLHAPNFRIVRIDLANGDPTRWTDIVPESDQRIQQFAAAGDCIYVTRTERFSTHLEVFDLDGARKGDVPFHGTGSIDLLDPYIAGNELFFTHTSISQPLVLYCHGPQDVTAVPLEDSFVQYDPSTIAIEEVSFPSRDGTMIPLLLAARKDLLKCGPLPTFLTGYGGFGTCVTPRFSAFATFLMEQGFLFAVPALRGGSELGEQWHRKGIRDNRQNSFDDFIAAAEWLLFNKRAKRNHIAIGGGSNAGLLVGAAITQRPDLFRAAICLGPLLDMTRYHLFDFAAQWAEEYGSPEDAQDFKSLLSYSPYHRVEAKTAYPAVLLISGDADTRCNPMHARKMAARLQSANASSYPILLDYKAEWGHTPVQPLSKKIEALTDRLAFVCHELAIPIENDRSADAVS